MDEFESIVTSDPTLRFFLREARFDADKLTHQANIVCGAAKIALWKYIDRLSKRAKS